MTETSNTLTFKAPTEVSLVYLEDSNDCDLCGMCYALGWNISIGPQTIDHKDAFAHCYDGSEYAEESDAYVKIFERLEPDIHKEMLDASSSNYISTKEALSVFLKHLGYKVTETGSPS